MRAGRGSRGGGSTADYSHYRTIVEQLGLAISKNRPVRLRHFSRSRGAERTFHVLPVALDEPQPALFESIPLELMSRRPAAAWSMWTTENAPLAVVLRFSATVADRVAGATLPRAEWRRIRL